uniref:Uncharacterized protein n=1 Tax=Nelumbo nucifera TaxID=4432 RepID=A0A822YVU8_NELNU|nr:TPA_asm: hypothetical protein HUJ06_006893 [Nelumbo nucifera]
MVERTRVAFPWSPSPTSTTRWNYDVFLTLEFQRRRHS